MIRFVSEKEVELGSLGTTKKTRSLQKPVEVRHQVIEVPEDYHTSSEALKVLKKHNDESALLKGRLSVLQIHEERNDFRAFVNEHRYQFHQHMRDEMQKQRQMKQRHLKKVLQQIHQSQEQARMDRLQHDRNMRKAHNQLNSSRKNDYSITKQLEKEIQMGKHQFTKEETERKRSRYYEIKQYEKAQKANVRQFMENKKMELQKNDSEEVMKISRLRDERQRQIQELGKLESMMLERQARSKMGSEESEHKLKKFLSNRQPLSTSHTTKLPQLTENRKSTEQDLFVL